MQLLIIHGAALLKNSPEPEAQNSIFKCSNIPNVSEANELIFYDMSSLKNPGIIFSNYILFSCPTHFFFMKQSG